MAITGRGVLIVTDPDVGTFERQTFTCCHCGIVRLLPLKVFTKLSKTAKRAAGAFVAAPIFVAK